MFEEQEKIKPQEKLKVVEQLGLPEVRGILYSDPGGVSPERDSSMRKRQKHRPKVRKP